MPANIFGNNFSFKTREKIRNCSTGPLLVPDTELNPHTPSLGTVRGGRYLFKQVLLTATNCPSNMRFGGEMRKLIVLTLLLAGCGGGGSSNSTPSDPVTPTAQISGQYNIVLTSTKNGSTNYIYTNLILTGTTLSSDTSTLACAGNLLINCNGDDPPAISFVIAGTVTGNSVQMSIPFSTATGSDNATLMGTATGTSLAGTYVDVQGDSGSWTGTKASSLTGNYTGKLQSSSNPTIAPTIMLSLTQATATTGLTGTAVVTNSTCFTSLALTGGNVIGGAFQLTNTNPSILIIALPTATGFTFQYDVGQDGACAGDSGTGTLN